MPATRTATNDCRVGGSPRAGRPRRCFAPRAAARHALWPAAIAAASLLAATPGIAHPQEPVREARARSSGVSPLPPPPSGPDTVTVVPDSSYLAGSFHRWLFGAHYRQLWATPIRVPVLDLAHFNGGLTPVKEGGGKQTKSLRLVDASGQEWVFRSVRKNPAKALPPELRRSAVADLAEDQMSSEHPGGALVAARIAEAAGILHATPFLYVMPDDARLGEYRVEYAGELGILEEYPDDGPDGRPGFAGARKIVSSPTLLEKIDASPEDRVDSRAFLAARLVDILLGDWDRHEDQWRWALFDKGKPHRWQPIARDRDQALVRFDGVALAIGRLAVPKFVRFDSTYPGLAGLTFNARDLDRRLLTPLDRADFDSIAAAVTARITDAVIDSAFDRLPPAYRERSGPVAAKLRFRRDSLAAEARRYYAMLATVVDVHGTDASDRAELVRDADGAVELRLFDAAAPAGAPPYFDRRFVPSETREVRVYLHGGADTATVRGCAPGVTVRVIVRGTDDRVATECAGAARIYRDPDVPHPYGPDTLFDRRPWVIGDDGKLSPPTQDQGGAIAPQVALEVSGDLGLVTRLGLELQQYGFRRRPEATSVGLLFDHSTGYAASRVDLFAERHFESSALGVRVLGRASQLEHVNFFGLGNASPGLGDAAQAARVGGIELRLDPGLTMRFGHGGRIDAGPTLRWSRSDSLPGAIVAATKPYGYRSFGRVGLASEATLPGPRLGDSRRIVAGFTAGASVFPAIWDVAGAFGEVHGEAQMSVSVRAPLAPVLALRAGGKRVWGAVPFEEAAYIGGQETLRGWREQRFAGDAAIWGGAELRVGLATVPILVPVDVGVLGLADVGRVYLDGESPGGWHTGLGGGVWFAFVNRANLLSLTVADGAEETRFYLRAGFTF
jgi:hypothetical protein